MSPYFPWTLAILAVVVVISSAALGAPQNYGNDFLRCGKDKCKTTTEDPCAIKTGCEEKSEEKDDCGCDDSGDDDNDDDGGCGCRRNLRTPPTHPPISDLRKALLGTPPTTFIQSKGRRNSQRGQARQQLDQRRSMAQALRVAPGREPYLNELQKIRRLNALNAFPNGPI